MIALDERLSMLSALVPACHTVADIGADHGFLGAWLLENGRCERAQLLDISADSLMKARRLVEKENLGGRVEFNVGDGAQALTGPAQAVIIAGMGGLTIAGIVQRGRKQLGNAALIMEPNIRADVLRETLASCGYRIDREELARAGGRWYVGIRAVPGQAGRYTQKELIVGPALLRDGHPLLSGYAAFRTRVISKALRGAEKGDNDKARHMAQELRNELAIWEEFLA